VGHGREVGLKLFMKKKSKQSEWFYDDPTPRGGIKTEQALGKKIGLIGVDWGGGGYTLKEND